MFRERITELEKETLAKSKENYILNSELDYENVRLQQLQQKNDNILSGVSVNRLADAKAKDRLIAEYERRLDELDNKLDKEQNRPLSQVPQEISNMELAEVKTENNQLKSDVARLTNEISELRKENSRLELQKRESGSRFASKPVPQIDNNLKAEVEAKLR